MFSFLFQNEYLGEILAPRSATKFPVEEIKALIKADKLDAAALLLSESSALTDQENIDSISERDGLNILHVACAANALTLVIELINVWGATVNVQSSSGNTPLHYAAVNGHANLVDVLLRYGADQSLPNHNGEIPFDLAKQTPGAAGLLLQNRTELADKILSPTALFHKRSVELKPRSDANLDDPLEQAVVTAATETAIAMSHSSSHRNYCKLVFGCLAVNPPELDRLRVLLTKDASLATCRTAGANLYGTAFNDGFTPLHAAAYHGQCDAIQILFDFPRVNAWVRDLQGKTPLHIAAELGHAEACKLLRARMMHQSNGIDPVGADAPLDLSGRTPMGCFSKNETGENQNAVRDAVFSPGDRSVLPRSPIPGRCGTSPWRISTTHAMINDKSEQHQQQFVYAFSEACGFKRQMEDQISLKCPLDLACFPSWSVFGVCDGHGGSACSKYLAQNFPRILLNETKSRIKDHLLDDEPDHLRKILFSTCAAIDAEMRQNPVFNVDVYQRDESSGQPVKLSYLDDSGSTGVFCLATSKHIVIANVGDSRAVMAQFAEEKESTVTTAGGASSNSIVSPSAVDHNSSALVHNLIAVPLSKDQKIEDAIEQDRARNSGAT